MSHDPFHKEPYLQTKLNEYRVETPDFPMKRNRWERFIHFLASPAKDPLERFISAADGVVLLKVAPIVGTVILTLIQIFIFL